MVHGKKARLMLYRKSAVEIANVLIQRPNMSAQLLSMHK